MDVLGAGVCVGLALGSYWEVRDTDGGGGRLTVRRSEKKCGDKKCGEKKVNGENSQTLTTTKTGG